MNKNTFLSYLHAADFGSLFLECGWNNPTSRDPLEISLGEDVYSFAEVAQQRGFRVFVCKTAPLPNATICRQLYAKIRKTYHDFLVVFVSTEEAFHHLWSVPVKSVAKQQLVPVEYVKDEQASFLCEKMGMISFSDDEIPTIMDVEARVNKAFLVNSAKITRQFYQGFKDQHKLFVHGIEGIGEEKERDWYASVMLNRLMFCYFIQKKGFLNLDTGYLKHKLEEVQEKRGQDQFYGTFYKRFLRKLFENGLNGKGRSEAFKREFGIIPYLNGGMFELHELEKKYPDLDIPDAVFEKLFAFFDKWHWHLDARITASGCDINPDVLGYIFEQYVNDRAKMGAYYTQEDITEYIGRNCIMPWLLEKVFGSERIPKWAEKTLQSSPDDYLFPAVLKGVDLPLPPEIEKGVNPTAPDLLTRRAEWNQPAPESYALPTEIWRETVARRQRCQEVRERIAAGAIATPDDFITFNLDIRKFSEDLLLKATDHLFVGKFYKAIREVTILDPTCGSGAFLFAALNILEPLYEACLDRMEEFNSDNPRLFKDELSEIKAKYRSNQKYFIYKNIILRNLYGVDIMHEATEIARLRLFLKMMAVVDVDPYDENLGLEPLPDIDFNIKCGNTLVGYTSAEDIIYGLASGDMFAYAELKQKIADELLKISTANHRFRETQLLPSASAAELAEQKRELQKRLTAIEKLLDDQLCPRGDRAHKAAWLKSVCPFHWHAEFHDIMAERGGFDVIIGNPPYVKLSAIKDYKLQGYTTMPCGNLYACVLERCLSFVHAKGKIGMIVPLSLVCSERMEELRKLYCSSGRKNWFANYEIFPSRLFDGAYQRVTILISSGAEDAARSFITKLHRWYSEERTNLFGIIRYTPCISTKNATGITKLASSLHARIIAKMDAGTPLVFSVRPNEHLIYYQEATNYWMKACMRVPYYKKDGVVGPPPHGRTLFFDSEINQFDFFLHMYSSAFYLWFIAHSDGFHLSDHLVRTFPASTFSGETELAQTLEKNVRDNAFITTRNTAKADIELESFRINLAKPIIDKIDTLLARSYGFTDEELDYIINYDIKYRMGDELNED